VRTLLSIHLPTFIFAIINLGILYWFLKKVLFGPVTKFMENRTKNIANSIQTAEQKLAEAEAMKENYENQLQNAKEQADAILKEARDRGAREYDNLIGQAYAAHLTNSRISATTKPYTAVASESAAPKRVML
jgi:F-type H+-transporting ATPase subunit b